ncbi:MAG: VOC family protein [Chloroflexota bacterium]
MAVDNPRRAMGIRLIVDDIAAVHQRVLDHAIRVARLLQSNDWGETTFDVETPDGIIVQFVSPDR